MTPLRPRSGRAVVTGAAIPPTAHRPPPTAHRLPPAVGIDLHGCRQIGRKRATCGRWGLSSGHSAPTSPTVCRGHRQTAGAVAAAAGGGSMVIFHMMTIGTGHGTQMVRCSVLPGPNAPVAHKHMRILRAHGTDCFEFACISREKVRPDESSESLSSHMICCVDLWLSCKC